MTPMLALLAAVWCGAGAATIGSLDDVRFLLWTRDNPNNSEYFVMEPFDGANLAASPFRGHRPTYVICHGYSGDGEQGWVLHTKTELLKYADSNVISVDYDQLVLIPWYNVAVQNMYMVANYTSQLLEWLHDETGLTADHLHITGHSLGAHTAGMTAKYFSKGTVARVTGLDPAWPLFEHKDEDHRLDRSDATFVDVIHTNSGSLIDGCIALNTTVGHVDFYVNGGKHQPGCGEPDLTSDWLDLFGGCSHNRAADLWVESIATAASADSSRFLAWPCASPEQFAAGKCPDCGSGCLFMGFPATFGAEDKYYLSTNDASPYALGDNQGLSKSD